LVPDSDYATNPGVAQAVKRLAENLRRKKAVVSVVLLPPGSNGEKTGADDFLAGGHTIDQLKALTVPFEETAPAPRDQRPGAQFPLPEEQIVFRGKKV
jgi:hypothetical protein